jgi:RAD50-interacting protein 1
MSSQQIKRLLAPPNHEEARQKTVIFLNSRFQSLDDLDDLESLVLKAKRLNDKLQANVRLYELYFPYE